MARGSKTSRIPRASTRLGSRRSKKKSSPATKVKAAIADRTRPTPRADRPLPRLLGRTALGIGLLVVLASFVNSFLLAPGRTWFGQRDEISTRQSELETIQRANDELQKDIDRLQTPAGIEDAAREELGFVMAGEERQTIVGDAQAPLALPQGWPYDIVTQIVGVREAEAAAKAAARAADQADERANEPATDAPAASEPGAIPVQPAGATPTTVTTP